MDDNTTYKAKELFRNSDMQINVYEPEIVAASNHQKHCFILHGWELTDNIKLPFPYNLLINPTKSKKEQIKSIHDALRYTLQKHGWTVWELIYPSEWTFPYAADLVLTQLKKHKQYNFNHTVHIGYSTGGLVARSMVAKGFPCHSLFTLATPHTGLLHYIDPAKVIPSVSAMLENSPELTALNCANIDKKMRHRYNFFGMTFNGHIAGLDYHDHDGLVGIASALGEALSPPPFLPVRMHLANRDGRQH